MLLEVGNDGYHFVANELFRGLANQFLIVGEFSGRENVFRGAGLHEETASAGYGPRQRRSGHGPSSMALVAQALLPVRFRRLRLTCWINLNCKNRTGKSACATSGRAGSGLDLSNIRSRQVVFARAVQHRLQVLSRRARSE